MSKNQGKKELIQLLNHKKKNPRRFMLFPTIGNRQEKREFRILDYLICKQHDNPHKYFVIEQIQPSWKREKELRFGYYILGKQKGARNKWVWGQFAPLIPLRDLNVLLRKAGQKGFIK